MQTFEICDCQWQDVLSEKKKALYYLGDRKDIEYGSTVLKNRTRGDEIIVRIFKVEYNEEKNVTTVKIDT